MSGGSDPAGDRLLSVEEARSAVLAAVAGPTAPELAYLSEARGRVLAEDVLSLTALPPWDNSAMDGYAIRAADVAAAADAAPVRLEVIGEVRAGAAPDHDVERGTAIRIATGAPIPPHADAVVQVELTTPADAAGQPAGERGRDAAGPLPAAVLVHEAVRAGTAIRKAGDDLSEAIAILSAGTRARAGGDRPGGGFRERDGHGPSTSARRESSRPATRSGRRGGSSDRPASRMRTVRGWRRWPRRPAPRP